MNRAMAGGCQQNNAGQNFDRKLPGIFHELLEIIQVIDGLGLNEFRAGFDLFLKLDQLGLDGICFGRDNGAGAEPHPAVQFVSRQVLALFKLPDGSSATGWNPDQTPAWPPCGPPA